MLLAAAIFRSGDGTIDGDSELFLARRSGERPRTSAQAHDGATWTRQCAGTGQLVQGGRTCGPSLTGWIVGVHSCGTSVVGDIGPTVGCSLEGVQILSFGNCRCASRRTVWCLRCPSVWLPPLAREGGGRLLDHVAAAGSGIGTFTDVATSSRQLFDTDSEK